MADQEDFRRFAVRHYDQLVGALSLYCGDPLVAEELAHDALIKARRRWNRVSQMGSPGGWLHRVAINLAHSFFRRRVAGRRARRRHGPSRGSRSPQHRAGSRQPDTVAESLAVRQALQRLSPRQRQTLVLRFFLDYSVARTAEVLEVSEGAVKSYTHRGLQSLRGMPEVKRTEVDDG